MPTDRLIAQSSNGMQIAFKAVPYKPLAVAAICIFSLSSFGCSGSTERSTEDDPIVATVDGHIIPASWFRRTYFDYLVKTGANDTPGNRYLHLDRLIDALLLSDEARRRSLADDSLYDVFVERERKKALGGRFYEEAFLEQAPELSEDDVRAAFAKWKTQVVVRHLFYLHPDSAAAAYRRLQAGRDFLEEAQRCYGLTSFDSSAGYLGPIRYFTVDDAFAEAAYALEPGEFSEPVQSRFGYHIIRAEDRIRDVLLTESEFQVRKGGIGKRERIRRLRLAGDGFVREHMLALNVQVNSRAVRALHSLLREAEYSVEPRPVTVLGAEVPDNDLADLLHSLDHSTVLATYTWHGQPMQFTLGDYLFWLPTLPYAERRNRTGASVGRALRNQVFADEGARKGPLDDEAELSVEREASLFLARHLTQIVRADTTVMPTEEQLQAAFDRYGFDRLRSVSADFWMITFDDLESARAGQRDIGRGRSPRSYKGFSEFVDVSLNEVPTEIRYYARQAPIDESVLVGLGSGQWLVLHVARRDASPVTLSEKRSELESKIRPYLAEYSLLSSLWSRASISVDTLAFEGHLPFE